MNAGDGEATKHEIKLGGRSGYMWLLMLNKCAYEFSNLIATVCSYQNGATGRLLVGVLAN